MLLTNALWIIVCSSLLAGQSGGLELISAANEDVRIESARSQIAAEPDDYVDLEPVRIQLRVAIVEKYLHKIYAVLILLFLFCSFFYNLN